MTDGLDPALASGSREEAAASSLPSTEGLHPITAGESPTSPAEWLPLFDAEESRVGRALARVAPAITALAEAMAGALAAGGRVVSFGAGTSGRLAALDAAEWGPTFGIDPDRVLARIAGGSAALTRAVEGAEDETAPARAEVTALAIGPADLVIGISASGSAAFVRAALEEAGARGATLATITAALPPPLDVPRPPITVLLDLGPELIAGSTRLQAATATHRVLQRASVLCAVASGWIHRGRMVEMRPTNRKLRDRAARIVAELASREGAPLTEASAREALVLAGDDIKVAIVSLAAGISSDEARTRLAAVGRRLDAIEEVR